MDFVAVVDQAIALLRQRGCLTYRTLQRQFQLDDAALDDLRSECTKVRKVSQGLLRVRRALNVQEGDFHRLHNRSLSLVTSCDEKAEKFSAYHVKKT